MRRRKVYSWRILEGHRLPRRIITGHRCFNGRQEMEVCIHDAPPTYVYRSSLETALIRFSDWAGLGLDPPLRVLHGVPVQVLCAGEVVASFDSGLEWISFPLSIRNVVSAADVQRAAHGYRVTLHRRQLRYVVRRKPEPIPPTEDTTA